MSNNDEFLWIQKYRPSTIQECILSSNIKNQLQGYIDKDVIGNFIFYGSAGTGKTSAACAMCNEIGADVLFIKVPSESSIDLVRTKITAFGSTTSLDGNIKVVILDEADRSTSAFQYGINSAIESFSANTRFILTSNNINKIVPALISRCTPLQFKIEKKEQPKLATQFMKRLQLILVENNIEYDNNVVKSLIVKYFPDFRRTINELQLYSSTGSCIDIGILSSLTNTTLNELVVALKSKDFATARKWIANNTEGEPSALFKAIYDISITEMKPTSIPEMVLILAKYSYQSCLVVDHELNNMAAIVELMSACSWI